MRDLVDEMGTSDHQIKGYQWATGYQEVVKCVQVEMVGFETEKRVVVEKVVFVVQLQQIDAMMIRKKHLGNMKWVVIGL